MQRVGYSEAELSARQFNERYAALLKFQVERTRELFMKGQPLPELVTGRLRYELRLTWHGGMRILEYIEEQHYDTLHQRPQITTADKLKLLIRTLKK